MIKTNEKKLPMVSVTGGIAAPDASLLVRDAYGYEIARIGCGGITYNFSIGDNCYDIVGEEVVPDVCSKGAGNFDTYICIGNKVTVFAGATAGAEGYVTGKLNGGKVSVWFPKVTIEKLRPMDQFLFYSHGVGLELNDHPEVIARNLDPVLLQKLPIEEEGEMLRVPVRKVIPGYLMGAGVGMMLHTYTGDYDIMTGDKEAVEEYGVNELCFGDLVLVNDFDFTMGAAYTEGATALCVVVHGGSVVTGHGPGVVPLLASKKTLLEAVIDDDANIGKYLELK